MKMLIAARQEVASGYHDVTAHPFSEDARLMPAQVYLRPERLAMGRRAAQGENREFEPEPSGDSSVHWDPETYYGNVGPDAYRAVAVGVPRSEYSINWRSGSADHLMPPPLRA